MSSDARKIETRPVSGSNARGGGVVKLSEQSAGRTRRNVLRGTLYSLGAGLALKVLGPNSTKGESSSVADYVKVEPVTKSNLELDKMTDENILRKIYPYSELKDVSTKIKNTEADMSTTLVASVLKNAEGYKQPIADAAGSKEVQLPDEIKALMSGMVIQESSANQFATSRDDKGNIIAKGPFQITDEIARAHNLNMADDNTDSRFDKNVSARTAAFELNDAYKYWEDWGMAIWEWHAGRTNLQKIVGTYLADNYAGESQRKSEKFGEKMKQYRLDAHKILTNDVIAQKFKDEDWDYTSKFLYRVAAASIAYRAATLR